MINFEIVSKYADAGLTLPERKTQNSAGYDFQVAEDIVIPSYDEMRRNMIHEFYKYDINKHSLTLEEMSNLTKKIKAKPTLIPTGIKAKMPDDMYLELSVRSSCPLKHWIILANGVGIIDSDYYNNPDNEGHIYFQVINLSPIAIQLKKGDIIGQGIFHKYYTVDNDAANAKRQGGFGSTDYQTNYIGKWVLPNLKEEEYVMACNPNHHVFIVGSEKTFTAENHDVEYSCP